MPLIALPSKLMQICEAIAQESGRAYLAGGIVRDALLGYPPKDIDLEIHNIERQYCKKILERFGHLNAVGKSFHVWILTVDNINVDIFCTDAPNIKEACRRRDLRINALLYDPLTDEILDPFGGLNDIKQKRLVATDPIFFAEDPLRVLRVAQFSARFNFTISPSLRELCLGLDLAHIAPERVLNEIEKSWLKSPTPSIAFREFTELKIIQKYFHSWSGLKELSVLESLDRGKSHCTNNNGWNMALFWGLALQRCSATDILQIFDQLNIHRYLNYPIRNAVLASLDYSKKLAQQENSILRNHAAEVFSLDFLCTIAMSIWPNGFGKLNLEHAKKEGIQSSPLPPLIQGRDVLPLGLKGQEIGRGLLFIRTLQLQKQIHNKEQALQAISTWLQKEEL